MEPTERAFIGLGANVGDAAGALVAAVAALRSLPDVRLAAVSRLYRTSPVGPVEQSDFLNAAVELAAPSGPTPERGAMALMTALKAIERAHGRQERERWGPREIDLDLLLYGEHSLRLEREEAARSSDALRGGVRSLVVPHPEASRRLFVLAPLSDLAPDLMPPGWDMTVTAARAQAEAMEGPEAVEVAGQWDAALAGWS